MAFVYVKVFYNKCPDCGQTWSAQLSQAEVIRLGKETFTCKCGKVWPTGHAEWAHLSATQRRGYFLSTAEIGVAIIFVLLPPIFGYIIGVHGWRSALTGLIWGGAIGAVIIGICWVLKSIYVALSLRRCPHEAPQRGK